MYYKILLPVNCLYIRTEFTVICICSFSLKKIRSYRQCQISDPKLSIQIYSRGTLLFTINKTI